MLILASTMTASFFAEAVLRIVLNPVDFLGVSLVSDPILGHRIEAFAGGHDKWGFRNEKIPKEVRVVAIGDSQTYGVSASANASWPSQLSKLLEERVYNAGLGGYGPLQYLHLAITLAPQLKPRLLVVGLYFGNDLVDSYRLAHNLPYWQSWRISHGSGNQNKSAVIATAGTSRPFDGLRTWLSRNSMFYVVLRDTLLRPLVLRQKERIARELLDEDVQMSWVDPSYPAVRTIFTPKRRLAVLDPAIIEVREGTEMTQRALLSLQQESVRLGADLMIVLIPTKERVYCNRVKDRGTVPTTLSQLCDIESAIAADLETFFREHEIDYVNVLHAMEAASERGQRLYPEDSDGHPMGVGYGVIAATVAEAIREQRNHH